MPCNYGLYPTCLCLTSIRGMQKLSKKDGICSCQIPGPGIPTHTHSPRGVTVKDIIHHTFQNTTTGNIYKTSLERFFIEAGKSGKTLWTNCKNWCHQQGHILIYRQLSLRIWKAGGLESFWKLKWIWTWTELLINRACSDGSCSLRDGNYMSGKAFNSHTAIVYYTNKQTVPWLPIII